MSNPFEQLGLNKEIVAYLNGTGKLDSFLKEYCHTLLLNVHPDRGGNTELAALVNSAFQEIKRSNGNRESLISAMGSNNNSEYLQIIEFLSSEVERLQKTEKENEDLRTKLAEALSGKVKAEKVRTPSGRKARVTEEESFTAEEPRVRTPPRAGARTT
ncbi:hypothetical protein HYX13_03175, partial [Candidatus Woesearchaeota archaeon]|nr:hypothetical protein [Candidatus Woesearchaeota archaeon]